MVAGSGLLVGLKTLRLGLRNRLVKLSLVRLVESTGLGVKSTRVVPQSLVLLVLGTTSAFETDARLAGALASVVSSLLGWDVLRVGATTGLTSATDADGSAGELFETRFVDAGFFRGDGGLRVERVLEAVVRLEVEVTSLPSEGEKQVVGSALLFLLSLQSNLCGFEYIPARRLSADRTFLRKLQTC